MFSDDRDELTPHSQEERKVLTVSGLNRQVRLVLEQQWGSIWLVGEISNFSAPSSGHWYFTLKDEQAQIRAAMFRGHNVRVRLPNGQRPTNGLQVLVRAKISLYEPRGDYQLIVEQLEPAGEGLLQQEFEALKRQLTHEGLFASERKKQLPEKIRTVGVITSPTGAAIRDVITVLRRRDPSLHVIIYPSQVQGIDAAQQLRHALATAVRRNEVDAILLTRGGGSLEDMWCFNDEKLAREIANCPLPTISAVGHEIDFTIADFVADVRAPTPSAAAELLSQDQSESRRHLSLLRARLNRSAEHYVRQIQLRWQHIQQRLQPLNPQQRLNSQAQQLDELARRAERAIKRSMALQQQRVKQQQQLLAKGHLTKLIHDLGMAQDRLVQQGKRAIVQHLNQSDSRFRAAQQALSLVSPLNTLNRGYTITFTEDGKIIRHANALRPGDTLRTRFAEGEIISTVKKIN